MIRALCYNQNKNKNSDLGQIFITHSTKSFRLFPPFRRSKFVLIDLYFPHFLPNVTLKSNFFHYCIGTRTQIDRG